MKALVEKFRAIGVDKEPVPHTTPPTTEYADSYTKAREDGRAKLDSGEWTSFTIEKRYKLEEVDGATKD